MKKSILLLALVAASFSASAQKTAAPKASTQAAPAGYSDMMAATIQELTSTGDPARLKEVGGKMERAAAVAPNDWLPKYYLAYGQIITCFVSKEDSDVRDKYLDQAEAALAQSRKLGGDESELLVLQAYLYQARLGVSPMMRAMTYPRMVEETLAKAKKINPANPRIYLVKANNAYYTPKMFGGGAEVAKPLYEEAKAKYAAFQPKSALAPNWGERQVLGRLKSYETASTN